MSDKQFKIIEARRKLRERFLRKQQSGTRTGPVNRHGQPALPPGQTQTSKWPVLDLGTQPSVSCEDWTLELRGLCASPQHVDYQALMQMPQVEEASDFHCVTAWSRLDLVFSGVRLIDLILLAKPDASATHIMCYGLDDYCTNLSLSEALKSNVLLAHGVGGEALPREHGGPVRMITPQLYAWKGAKWICAIEFMDENRPGFWEKNGYSMDARPWLEDRYS